MSKELSLEQYQHAMSEVTNSFQSLSKEVKETVRGFSETGLTEAADILERLQQAEKEKLEMTVKWQVLSQQESASEEDSAETESDDFGVGEHKKNELRKKYSQITYLIT